MITFTPEQFVQKVREVIRDRGPEYRYSPHHHRMGCACFYQVDGVPSCLFGEVFERLGVPYDRAWEGQGIQGVLARLLGGPGHLPLPEEWSPVTAAARHAQIVQDEGKPYDAVLDRFEVVLTVHRTNP